MSEWLRRRGFAIALVVAIAAAGTAYLRSWAVARSAWKRDLQSAGFVDEMPGPSRGDRIVVVAPHPDDEVLGCGGLIQQAVAAGAEIHVVLMTNGDGSQLSLIFGERKLPWRPGAYVDLGRKRQQESRTALALQGLEARSIHYLGYPNAGLLAMWRPEHWRYSDPYQSPYTHVSFSPYPSSFTPGAPYCGQQVLADLLTILRQVRPTAIFVTHPKDIHPDHWATCCFVRYALASLAVGGASWARETKVYGYLIHWPRYPQPVGLAPSRYLLPPSSLSGRDAGWFRLSLTAEQVKRKMQGIRTYGSQEPRFDRLMLSFARRNESFEILPVTDAQEGTPTRWSGQDSHRRGLGGAELMGVDLTVTNRLAVRADVTRRPQRLPRDGYIGLDLRTWSVHGAPVITTAYVRDGDQISAMRLGPATEVEELRGTALSRAPGRLEIAGLALPRDSAAPRDVFVTCWGSIRDRATDPAVVSWVRLRDTSD
jgi:LmbE family N-acetylglucosaminyl deacetylase